MKKIAIVTCLILFIFSFNCKLIPEPEPMISPPLPPHLQRGNNGPLSNTAWAGFAFHVYSGPNAGGNQPFDPNNKIYINNDGTTTLLGEFWDNLKGETFPSNYIASNPDFTIPTPPRIFVNFSSNNRLEIIQGGHAELGVIMWVQASLDGHRADFYFQNIGSPPPPGSDGGDVFVSSGLVSNFVGYGTVGDSPGVRTTARFNSPQGIAVDGNFNIWITDTGNHRIKWILNDESINFAGSNTAGDSPGTRTTARFSSPHGIAVCSDSSIIYITDTGNHRIKKIVLEGEAEVTNFAGSNTAGDSPDTGTAARFNSPQGIAVCADGYIYVTDTGNHRVKKIELVIN